MRISRTVFLLVCLVSTVLAEIVFNDDFPLEEIDYDGKEGDLVQVSMVTRHGQRTPKNPYPSDPWGVAKYWPEGWLQLTEEGAKQHKTLGKWLRERYSKFIPEKYKTSDILIRSTGISRTLASAYALSSGLYPDDAVPIFSSPSEFDKLFSPHKVCPAFDEEMERFLATPEVKSEEYHRKPFYDWLALQIGKTVHGLEISEALYSLMMIEEQRGFVLPKWTEAVYPQPLKNLTGRYLSRSSATPLLARLRYGSLLKDILTHGLDAGRSYKSKKVLIYSAHDFTVVGLLNCLGIFDGAPSGFASALIFETRRGKKSHENVVKIFYRNDSFAEPKLMNITGCEEPCTFKRLLEVLSPILPDNVEDECQVAKANLCAIRTAEDVSLLWATAIGSAGLGALLVVCCSKLYICYRPPQWQLYQPHIMNCERRKPDYSVLEGKNSYFFERL